MNHKALLPSTLAAVALATLTSAGSAHAQAYMESGDAGQTLSTAASTGSGGALTSVSGTLTGVNDADLYRIFIANPATFSATISTSTSAVYGAGALDTSLFLFDLNGRAIIANDDASGLTVQSALPAFSGMGGIYLLGISLSGNEPINSVNQTLFTQSTTPTDVRTANSGLSPATFNSFNSNAAFADSGPYGLSLTGVTAVPEPSTWALTGMGALALGVTLVRRNRQTSVVSSL